MTAKIELKNEQILEDAIESIFHTWWDPRYEVTVQEYDGFVYIQRLDVTEGYRGQGIGTAVVKAVRRRYGTVVAAPEGEKARAFFKRIGTEDERGELMRQPIWILDQGYGVYIIE